MTAASPPRRRVRVWFGQYLIGDYIGEPAYANRYEAAMRRRFPGLDITNDPLGQRAQQDQSRAADP
ncbi:MAG TPA: hypothetical protein VFG33_30350 [Kribbella sp.]|uniref:hypothetical protein n=1 Tax=Kribbella sp. TaxID=1871183 RepID=UPI002D79F123|nr:hypothetical protein [Kribbella sp.]HET6297725.1 hypothetical protein [Kribbella sp.]